MRRVAERRTFWFILAGVVMLDVVTKTLAVAKLSPIPQPVFGDWFTLQLVYNPGAAFGIHVGEYSRLVFSILALIALAILGVMVKQTAPTDRGKLLALGLVCGGAVGNMLDRLRHARGVVDFLDLGIGMHRWPTFNVADVAVTVGVVALGVILWSESREFEARTRPGPAEAST